MVIILNILIPIIIFFGFFIFYGKSNGWFKEGGLVYEWAKSKKEPTNPKLKKGNKGNKKNNK